MRTGKPAVRMYKALASDSLSAAQKAELLK
jgi:hypothetical protein